MTERTGSLTWVQFGDLHLRRPEDENFLDYIDLIDEVNSNLQNGVDFAFLPGDNADDGTDAEYELVRRGLDSLKLPAHIITGDHDRKAGSLDAYRRNLQADLYRSVSLRNFALILLNAMDGADSTIFDLGGEQSKWLQRELSRCAQSGLRPLLFVHLYPRELATRGREFSKLLRERGVELVEMGHTHYNELANDGRIIYAATRSTGQIEEGPPGFSFTVIDEDVISWKFKRRGAWPFVMITSPADYRLITGPESARQVVREPLPIRARAWDRRGVIEAKCSIDGAAQQPMERTAEGCWQCTWDLRGVDDGVHSILVEVQAGGGDRARDELWVLVLRRGEYVPPPRFEIDYENTVGAWPEKGILGTQLGPNENGTKGPWPSWRIR